MLHFNKKNIIYFVIIYFFSLSILLMSKINYKADFTYNFINSFHFDITFFITGLVISIFTLILILFLFKLIDKIKIKNNNNSLNAKKIWLITFFGLILAGIIHLVTFYPGNIMVDTLYILKDPIGTSGQHPLFYNLLISLPYKIFNKLFNNVNASIFIICILQLVMISSIISTIIVWFYNKFKNKKITIILILYFIITPIVTNYNTTLVKDSLFCVALLSFIPITYEIICSKGNWLNKKINIIITITTFSFTCLVRNNGIYVVIILFFFLLVVYRQKYKSLLFIFIIVLVASKLPSLFPGQKKQMFQEQVGIPIQQIAYVIHTDGKITNTNKQFLNKIYSYESYKSNYNPYIVDAIKWDINFNRDFLDENKFEFIKVWFDILPKNFESYIKSYLLSTYGLWSFESFQPTQSNFLGIDHIDANVLKMIPNLKSQQILPNIMQKNLTLFYKHTTKYFGGGTCLWLLILTSIYIVYKKKYHLLILSIPLYATWLSLMIASPFSLAFRYMSPFMYLLPFILSIVLIKTREN